MKSLIISLCFLLIPIISMCQGELIGVIHYQNSNSTPAVGVELRGVSAISDSVIANRTYSLSGGEFILKFPQTPHGHPVRPIIGKNLNNQYAEDANGKKIELVNDRELKLISLPSNPNDAPIKIIVCPKGQRDIAARKYYRIIENSYERTRIELTGEIDVLYSQKKKDYKRIESLSAKVNQLEQERDSMQTYSEAIFLASINKDDDNIGRVLDYLECIENGGLIRDCKNILDIEKATKTGLKSIKNYEGAILELETRGRASKSTFDYADAVSAYDSILHLLNEFDKLDFVNISPLKMATYYNLGGEVLGLNAEYERSLEYNKKTVALQQQFLSPEDPVLITAYNNLAIAHQGLLQYDEALKIQKKAIAAAGNFKADNPSNWIELASLFDNTALSYAYLENYDKALYHHNLSISIRESMLSPTHYQLGSSYNNIGLTYLKMGKNNLAIEYQTKALTILEANLNAMNPKLAIIYHNIASSYVSLKKYHKAIEYLKMAVSIQEMTLKPMHNDLANVYNSLALAYAEIDEKKLTIKYQKKSLIILEHVLPPQHPDLSTAYSNMSLAYLDLKSYNQSLAYMKKAIEIQKNIATVSNPILSFYYYKMGVIYGSIEEYDKALDYATEGASILDKAFPKDHPSHKGPATLIISLLRGKSLLDFKNKKYQSALGALQQLVERSPDGRGYNFIGLCHYYLENYKEAIQAYQKCKELAPELTNSVYYNNVGMAYAKNKQFKKAKEAFEQVENFYPVLGRTYRNWAMYFALKGEENQALLNLEKAIKYNYTDINWLETDTSMDVLRNLERFNELLKKLKEK